MIVFTFSIKLNLLVQSEVSSEPSPQSSTPSQYLDNVMHFPFRHLSSINFLHEE